MVQMFDEGNGNGNGNVPQHTGKLDQEMAAATLSVRSRARPTPRLFSLSNDSCSRSGCRLFPFGLFAVAERASAADGQPRGQ